MKKRRFLTLIFASMILIIIPLGACSSDDEPSQAQPPEMTDEAKPTGQTSNIRDIIKEKDASEGITGSDDLPRKITQTRPTPTDRAESFFDIYEGLVVDVEEDEWLSPDTAKIPLDQMPDFQNDDPLVMEVDNETTWIEQESGTSEDLYCLYFIDSNTGWAGGSGPTIIKTSNGGQNWQSQNGNMPQNPSGRGFSDINDIRMLANGQKGWASGTYSVILKTTNGGEDWSGREGGYDRGVPFKSVSFANDSMGWITAFDGLILKSTNGGESWESVNAGTYEFMYNMSFINSEIGWAVGKCGRIIKTTNGGSSWSAQNSCSVSNLYAVDFTNSNNGWAVGSSGTILHTSNGGESWTAQDSNTTSTLYGVHFLDQNEGWAVGSSGTIVRTYTGGDSWIPVSSSISNNLRAVQFVDSDTGWIVGDDGTILKTTTGNPLDSLIR